MQLMESAGWWVGDEDCHGVEISVAGGVVEMVRDPTPKRFFFLFYFIFFIFIMYSLLRYKNSHAALAMA